MLNQTIREVLVLNGVLLNNLYHRLQVEQSASQAEIRSAYRRLALMFHPDRRPGDKSSQEAFVNIVTAFEILSDPKARALYDSGRIDSQGRPVMARGVDFATKANSPEERSKWAKKSEETKSARTESKADIGEGKTTNCQDKSDNLETKSPDGKKTSKREKQYKLAIDFTEACLGAVKRVRLPEGKELKISIPAGVKHGQRLRVKDRATEGLQFVVKVSVEPHMLFTRNDNDIALEVPLTPYEAYFGAELDIPTIHGGIKLVVPAGSKCGDKVRVSGFGIRPAVSAYGDLIAHLKITLPTHWPDRLEIIMSEWRTKAPYNPRSRISRLLAE